jgi:2-hydroxy-6-oxonona-2,4-dienedioate hydrolase
VLSAKQLWWGGALSLALIVVAAIVVKRFDNDLKIAAINATKNSTVVTTRCGQIEYQESGTGKPLLMVHGSGGGHDQGMAFAGDLAKQGIRVIAMSRFGYLRTPMPADSSPQAQADAHVCLLDVLGIQDVAIVGGSAGGPSALQLAIRHPNRVNALILLVPLAYKPSTTESSALPLAPWAEAVLMKLIGSDFLFWAALHIARDQVIKYVLATPPQQVHSASSEEQARINHLVDLILPVSVRSAGLRSDSGLGRSLGPSDLSKVLAPTLIVSVRDDGFGTYASSKYTASQISGAQFQSFEHGGHVWVGHNREVMNDIAMMILKRK